MKRVVITGIGSICSAGIGHEEVFKNICEKRQNIQPIDINTEARETLKTRFFVPYPEIDDTKYAEKLLKVKKGTASIEHDLARREAQKAHMLLQLRH